MNFNIGFFLLFLVLLACSNNPQSINEISDLKYIDSHLLSDELSLQNESPYPYDTLLKGGFVLAFRTNGNNNYLFLKKESFIKEIASCSKGLPYKNLGYKVADFNDHFVLAKSFGSGNPHFIQVIRKGDGENIVENEAVWIGADEKKELLLYTLFGDTSKNGKIVLLDVSTNKNQVFSLPDEMREVPDWYNYVRIDSVAEGKLVIQFNIGKDEMTSTFTW